MAWRRKEDPVLPPAPAKPEQRPDEIISEMLAAYQRHFYETAKGKPDPSVEAAKVKVARANKIVSDSRIGYSVCSLLEHVRNWGAWSKRDDFQKYVAFPATDVTGTEDKTDKNHDRRTIDFRYSGVPYTVIFIERGVSSWSHDDLNSYGSVELLASYKLAIGLDISKDISKEYDRWHFNSVSAFAPGDWMKHVVEMSALIDAHQSRQMSSYDDEDALRRAAQIKL
jgi:hypothetical protein